MLVRSLHTGVAFVAPWKLWREAQNLGLIEAVNGDWRVSAKGLELVVRP